MIKELFMKKKFQPISISIFLMWALFLIEKGFNKKEIVGSKWTFKISMADCIPRTFLIEKVAWKSSLIGKNETRYAKMKFLEHGSCLNLVGSSPSKASAERQREVHETRQDAIEVAGEISTLRLDPKLVLKGSLLLVRIGGEKRTRKPLLLTSCGVLPIVYSQWLERIRRRIPCLIGLEVRNPR